MSVVDGGSMTGSDGFTHQEVDSNAIFGMDHYQAAQLGRAAQHAIKRLIIDHEGIRVSHQEFKSRHACCNHFIHRGLGSGGEVSDRDVKAVIDNGLSLCLAMPGLKSFSKAMPALLIGEIENRGRTTTGGGNRTRLKVITCDGGGQWKFHMRMHIDGSWEDIFTLGVKHCISLQRSKSSRRGNGDNSLIVDEYVTRKITGCGDDMPIGDAGTHSWLLLLKFIQEDTH